MKKLIIITLILVLLIGSIFSAFLVYYNKTSHQDELEYQNRVTGAIVGQEAKNRDFYQQQGDRANYQATLENTANSRDNDGDGLTYEEERRINTDDNNWDSDGDGISDREDIHPAGGGQNYAFTVNWQHQGDSYTTQFGIPEDKYYNYKNKPRTDYYYQDGRFATPDDLVIRTIASDVADAARTSGGNPYTAAVDFVESMTYQYDIDFNNNRDYPKYAIETIVDQRGDCEDTSFLMASILEALGVDTIFLLFSDHAAIGVECDGCSGKYYTYSGKRYYFLETTDYADNWVIGGIWGKYRQEDPRIIDVGN